jgi:hypothetical protein
MLTPEEEAAKVVADAAAAKAAEDAKAAANVKPETYQVKINGEMRDLTLAELKEHASKAAGADEVFRSAAQMKEDAKKGIEIGAAFKKINSGEFDATDVRKLAELTGQDADEAVAAYTASLKKGNDKGDGENKATPAAKKIAMEDLPEDMQEIMRGAREAQIEDAQEKIAKLVEAEVAKDELLGKIVLEAPDNLQAGIKEFCLQQVKDDVQKKILASPYSKEKFGTEMIRNSIQKTRAGIKKLGIPSKADKQADRISLLAGLVRPGDFPAEVYTDEKITRVDSNDPNYHDNAAARLGQKMRQAAQRGA